MAIVGRQQFQEAADALRAYARQNGDELDVKMDRDEGVLIYKTDSIINTDAEGNGAAMLWGYLLSTFLNYHIRAEDGKVRIMIRQDFE